MEPDGPDIDLILNPDLSSSILAYLSTLRIYNTRGGTLATRHPPTTVKEVTILTLNPPPI